MKTNVESIADQKYISIVDQKNISIVNQNIF